MRVGVGAGRVGQARLTLLWAPGRRWVTVVLAVALLVRLPLLGYDGLAGDLQIYASWGAGMLRHPLEIYSLGAGYPVNYPPLMLYLYGGLAQVYRALAPALTGAQPTFVLARDPGLAPLLKLPMLLADLGTVALLAAIARRALPPRGALAAALAYALSPTVLLAGTFWGQTDALSTALVVAALLLLVAGGSRPAWAGLLLGAAVMLKPQALVFLPLCLLYLWRWGDWRTAARAAGAFGATVFIVCLPYLLPPRLEIARLIANESWVVRDKPYASVDAFNLWVLLGQPHHRYDTPLVGPFTPNLLGLALFGLIYLVVGVGIWRSSGRTVIFLGAALVAIAFFEVTCLQRERYLFPALALLFAAACAMPRVWPLYAMASATLFLNMFVTGVPQPTDTQPFWLLPPAVAQLALHGRWLVALVTAALNLGLLMLALRSWLAGPWRATRATPPAPPQLAAAAAAPRG